MRKADGLLIFISNEPRTYEWGSKEALPEILQKTPTGQPQAELWLGDHAGAPAQVAKACGEPLTLIDLINQAPEVYGVDGGSLPFLLKVLGIGGPLSLQVHPNKAQAKDGFDAETAEGVALESPERSYKDLNHKPELLVALTEVRALVGFRALSDVASDLRVLASEAGTCGAKGSQQLLALAVMAQSSQRDQSGEGEQASQGVQADVSERAKENDARVRDKMLDWIFSGKPEVALAIEAIARVVSKDFVAEMHEARMRVLRELGDSYPADVGVLVSLMMHITELEPGEAIFVEAGQLHAYLCGVGVEVMASSDNVLRGGLTPKHVDHTKLREILDLNESGGAKFNHEVTEPGLISWNPRVPDFSLHRARLAPPASPFEGETHGSAESLSFKTQYPVVMIATEGKLQVERIGGEQKEVANVRKGQSLYISAGTDVEITGAGEAFLATVGMQYNLV